MVRIGLVFVSSGIEGGGGKGLLATRRVVQR